ncbi:MAG TPA: glycosyltransferase family 9 protein [Opitutaceae bacterium]
MRALLFKVNQLGDNIAFVGSVQDLRRRCPGLHLTVLTTPGSAELYGGALGPQELITCEKRAFECAYRAPWRLAAWVRRLRGMRPDACLVSFDQSSVAHWVSRTSGAPIRIGGALGRPRAESLLTERVPIPDDHRPATWNWRMAAALARAAGTAEPWPEEPPAPDLGHLLSAPRYPGRDRRRIVVHSGASRSLNQWPADRFAAVAASLACDHEVVWIAHGATTGRPPPGLVETRVGSLVELAGWLAGADLFLGNNSGPMHLANALGCAGVAVTGPSALGWDPFWHRERWIVLRPPDLACAPCENLGAVLRGCANTANPMACLAYSTPERVVEACRSLLARPRAIPA